MKAQHKTYLVTAGIALAMIALSNYVAPVGNVVGQNKSA